MTDKKKAVKSPKTGRRRALPALSAAEQRQAAVRGGKARATSPTPGGRALHITPERLAEMEARLLKADTDD